MKTFLAVSNLNYLGLPPAQGRPARRRQRGERTRRGDAADFIALIIGDVEITGRIKGQAEDR